MQDIILSVKELCAELNISRATLYRLIDEGLPYNQVGKKKLFTLTAVSEFMSTHRNETAGKLEVGKEYTNDEIVKIFKVGNMGGMRRSHTTNALVLISFQDGAQHLYHDRWNGDILIYTGQGTEGDQDFNAFQNKTLYESDHNGITVYLFEMFTSQKYQYRGIAVLADTPYLDTENDINGNPRKVCRFPLRLINSSLVSEEFIKKEEETQIDELKTLPRSEIVHAATQIKAIPSKRTVLAERALSNTVLLSYIKLRANGKCECCGQPAPFEVNGEPYLEATHLIPPELGGYDSVDNMAAVCPNCNRRIAYIGNDSDLKAMRKNISKNEKDLQGRLRPNT